MLRSPACCAEFRAAVARGLIHPTTGRLQLPLDAPDLACVAFCPWCGAVIDVEPPVPAQVARGLLA